MKKVISYILTVMMAFAFIPCFTVQANAASDGIDEYYELSIEASDGWDAYYEVIDLDKAATAEGCTVVLPYGMITELDDPADNNVRIEINPYHQKIEVSNGYTAEYSENVDADPDIAQRFIKEMDTPAKAFSETVTVKTDHSEYTFKINFKEASASEIMTPEIYVEFQDGVREDDMMGTDINAEEAATAAGTTVVVPYLYDDEYGINMFLSTYRNEKVTGAQEVYHMNGKDELKVEFTITSPDGKNTKKYKINFVRDKVGDAADLQTCNVYASESDGRYIIKEYEFDVDMKAAKTAEGAYVEVPAEFIDNEYFTFYVLADSVNYGTFHYKWEFGQDMEAAGYLYAYFAEQGQTVYTYTFSITSLNGKVTNNFKINLVPEGGTPGDNEPDNPGDNDDEELDVTRLSGSDRYETAIQAADCLKEIYGIEKFDTIIVASGASFADALAGSYLAYVETAPILLVGKDAASEKYVGDYIKANLASDGTVYILGGVNAITANFEKQFGKQAKRLAGASRYETNIEILKAAGVTDEELLVATGLNFADSLSASAAQRPILLVQGDSLTAEQTAYMKTINPENIYILGGKVAVSNKMENALKAYDSQIDRLAGASRYETSAMIAEEFFPEGTALAVLAYGLNYPDGLSGGPIAQAAEAPLLLVTDAEYKAAKDYAKDAGVEYVVMMGGNKVLADKTGYAVLGK